MDRRIKQTILAELRTDHEVWDFLIDKLGPALIKGQRYNGESIRPQDKGMIMRDHMVVMQFQLRQVRVDPSYISPRTQIPADLAFCCVHHGFRSLGGE